MKSRTIKTPTAELMIVELPRLCDYHASSRKLWVKDTQSGEELTVKGSWELLGKPDEIREEGAEKLVEKVMNGQHFQNYKGRKEKDFANLWCRTAKESLLSLLESEGVIFDYDNSNCTNQFCENGKIDIGYGEYFYCSVCEEAELRTFDRRKTLIFVKK